MSERNPGSEFQRVTHIYEMTYSKCYTDLKYLLFKNIQFDFS